MPGATGVLQRREGRHQGGQALPFGRRQHQVDVLRQQVRAELRLGVIVRQQGGAFHAADHGQ